MSLVRQLSNCAYIIEYSYISIAVGYKVAYCSTYCRLL